MSLIRIKKRRRRRRKRRKKRRRRRRRRRASYLIASAHEISASGKEHSVATGDIPSLAMLNTS